MTMIAAAQTTEKSAQMKSPVLQRRWKQWPAQTARIVGAALALLGGAEMSGVVGKAQGLDILDPGFGLAVRHLMLAAGMVELAVSFILLFTNRPTLGLGLTAWAAMNFMVYRIGLWSLGWHHAFGFMVDPLGLSLKTTDALTSLLTTCLLIGSCGALWIERRMEHP